MGTVPPGCVVEKPLSSASIQHAELTDPTGWPLPTTVMPPSDTAKPRARSCSLSTPTAAPSGTTILVQNGAPDHGAPADLGVVQQHRLVNLG